MPLTLLANNRFAPGRLLNAVRSKFGLALKTHRENALDKIRHHAKPPICTLDDCFCTHGLRAPDRHTLEKQQIHVIRDLRRRESEKKIKGHSLLFSL
jgi:hypothetical protein